MKKTLVEIYALLVCFASIFIVIVNAATGLYAAVRRRSRPSRSAVMPIGARYSDIAETGCTVSLPNRRTFPSQKSRLRQALDAESAAD
jgi:hypothetical protein